MNLNHGLFFLQVNPGLNQTSDIGRFNIASAVILQSNFNKIKVGYIVIDFNRSPFKDLQCHPAVEAGVIAA